MGKWLPTPYGNWGAIQVLKTAKKGGYGRYSPNGRRSGQPGKCPSVGAVNVKCGRGKCFGQHPKRIGGFANAEPAAEAGSAADDAADAVAANADAAADDAADACATDAADADANAAADANADAEPRISGF